MHLIHSVGGKLDPYRTCKKLAKRWNFAHRVTESDLMVKLYSPNCHNSPIR